MGVGEIDAQGIGKAARPRWDSESLKVAGIVDGDAHREELSYVTFLVSVGRRVHDIVRESEHPVPSARRGKKRPLAWSGMTAYAQKVTERS